MIATLFVEKGGAYFDVPGVDPWDIERDARTYPGPHPVIAHPPCERWGRYAKGCPTNQVETPGADGGCFATALHSVRLWGGVLEHPKDSLAWEFFGLTRPFPTGWTRAKEGEWVCQVDQAHYGHPARKTTWLLYVGPKPNDLIWGPAEQRLCPRSLSRRGYEKTRKRGIIEGMSSKQRQRTPPEFREALIRLASHAQERP